MEWSKGVIFLMATFWPEGLCKAEHTTPYAPSPTTSWMSYCSETLKEIFLELPLPAGGMVAVVVDGCARARWVGSRRVEAQMVVMVVVVVAGLRLRLCGGRGG
ncbi:hypothetical protein J3E74DRAFT_329912 [Bipolaris maydis]|nr:hypothetical protein J3E74DRAFT_329912 [Bipolaris maydis]